MRVPSGVGGFPVRPTNGRRPDRPAIGRLTAPVRRARAALDEDSEPAHVVRCGRVDPRGVKGGTKDAERTIRYITKYLTKDITDHVTPTADDDQEATPPRRYEYELAKPGDADVLPEAHRIMRAISARAQWRQALDRAKQRLQELTTSAPAPLAA